MNHESLSIPEDGEVWCELEERQYQKFKARLIKEGKILPNVTWTASMRPDFEFVALCNVQDAVREVDSGC